jgi:large subunit ribosomal protein L1
MATVRSSKKAGKMGVFTVNVEFGTPDRNRFESFRAVADSGALFSWLPKSVLEKLGHTPALRRSFVMADGREEDRDVAEVPLRLRGDILSTLCVFGEEETPPILGALAMEQFLVAPDPVHQQLIPIRGLALLAERGKKYRAALEKLDRTRTYEPKEAVSLVKETAFANFDESVELHVRTGLDTRHADQQLRGTIVLPNGLGKGQRVLVFAEGEAARIAEQAGADTVGADDLIKKVEGGFLDFEVALAVKEMMGKVGRLGRVLGPRGLMPNPRTNTVVEADDLPKAIRDSKQGRVEFRTDRTNLVHVPLGKVSFTEDALMENLASLIDAIVREKPSGAKGQYIRSLTLTTTMGPGIKLDIPATLSGTTAATV